MCWLVYFLHQAVSNLNQWWFATQYKQACWKSLNNDSYVFLASWSQLRNLGVVLEQLWTSQVQAVRPPPPRFSAFGQDVSKKELLGGPARHPGMIEHSHCGVWAWDPQASSSLDPAFFPCAGTLLVRVILPAKDTIHTSLRSTLFPSFCLLTESYSSGLNSNITSLGK